MISEGDFWVVQHRSGRYMQRRLHFVTIGTSGCHDPAHPSVWIYRLVDDVMEADRARNALSIGRLLAEHYWDRDQFHITRGPVCTCCGDWGVVRHRGGFLSPYRCEKHRDRNPCLVEGCTRTRPAPVRGGRPVLANNQTICGDHWRRYVPPRSLRRRAYHAFWRKAKRHGWTPELDRQFERFWNQLVDNIRFKAEGGTIDVASINRLFGWDGDNDAP